MAQLLVWLCLNTILTFGVLCGIIEEREGLDVTSRVNRIAVYVGDRHDKSIITLYRTNTRLVELTNDMVGIPDIHESGVDRNTYMQYCKDVIINLLENGGIEGFHWEPKKIERGNNGEPITHKFNSGAFRSEAVSRVSAIMDELVDGSDIKYRIDMFADDTVDIKERYKDMNVKYGSTIITVNIGGGSIKIPIEIRSGQICKPKSFIDAGGNTKQLNITTIRRIFG